MRLKIFPWLRQDFISLSWEGDGKGSIAEETRDLLTRFDERLGEFGLRLDNTVRTRLWARDFTCWQAGTNERARILSGMARSVSSSHVRPERLGTHARIAIDLMAMFPPADGAAKTLREYEPKTNVLRSLRWGGILFCSGQSNVTTTTFDAQFPIIIKNLSETLSDGGGSWEKVARASFFLHRDEPLKKLRDCFSRTVKAAIPSMDYTTVDSRQGKRLEIELTACPSD